ncbi:MAG: hypothetical protein ACRCZZ_05465 [Phocaeicola sp.]
MTQEERQEALRIFINTPVKGTFNICRAGTGFGKTHFISNHDWDGQKVLVLTSRRSLVDDVVESGAEVSAYTYQAFEQYRKEKWDIIICDEVHSLVIEQSFSMINQVVFNWIEEQMTTKTFGRHKTVVYGFSATVDNIISAMKLCEVPVTLGFSGENVHKVKELSILKAQTKMKSVLDTTIGDAKGKQSTVLVFHNTIREAVSAYELAPEQSTVIRADGRDRIKVDNTWFDLNQFDDDKKELLSTQMFPDGIRFVHATSVLTEGVNISSKQKVDSILSTFTMIEQIVQSVGRLRADVDHVIIKLTSVERMIEQLTNEVLEIEYIEKLIERYWNHIDAFKESVRDEEISEKVENELLKEANDIQMEILRSPYIGYSRNDSSTITPVFLRRAYCEVVLKQLHTVMASRYQENVFIPDGTSLYADTIKETLAPRVYNGYLNTAQLRNVFNIKRLEKYHGIEMSAREINELIQECELTSTTNSKVKIKSHQAFNESFKGHTRYSIENNGKCGKYTRYRVHFEEDC